MVNYCSICDEKFVKGSEISFHKFPKPEERRKLWINACKPYKRKSRVITPTSLICSQHFKPDDFVWNREAGVRILKNTAIPSIFTKDKLNPIVQLSDSSPKLLITSNTGTVTIIEQSHSPAVQNVIFSIATDTPQVLKKDVGTMCKIESDIRIELCSCIQSFTETSMENIDAPNVDENLPQQVSQDFEDQINSGTPRKIWRPSRVGDMNEEHFSTPKDANMNFSLLKAKISDQRKKIKMINQRNRRLRKKVQGLKSLLEHLRGKHC